jgi:hypothetical protein
MEEKIMLTSEEYLKLEIIQEKIISSVATNNETQVFLDLIVKSGSELEMLDYMKTIGFNSIAEIEAYLRKNKKNDDLTTALVIAGGAILLAFLLNR